MARLNGIAFAWAWRHIGRLLQRRAAVVAAAVLGAAMLAACGGGSDGATVTVYEIDFSAAQAPTWLGYPRGDAARCEPLPTAAEPSGNEYAVSSAPWWVDSNHAAPGAGYLHLVGYAYHHDWSVDGEITVPSPGRPMDLRNATVRLRYRAPALQLPPSARLYFWFQTRIADDAAPEGGAYVNYVLDSKPLPTGAAAGDWLDVALHLPADESHYRCLGSNPARADQYRCAESVADALRDWNADLGFVILFPDEGAAAQVAGSIEFDRVSIELPFTNLLTHEGDSADLLRGASTCRA